MFPSMLCALAFTFFQSTSASWTTVLWPVVAIIVTCLIVYSQWGRSVRTISSKWVTLERQVSDATSKTEQHGQQLGAQQRQLEEQQRLLQSLMQDVARYSISDYIFYVLFYVDKAQRTSGEYVYHRDGTMGRNFRFLMDHGYIEELFPEPNEGTNIREMVKITPAGRSLLALRERTAAAPAA